jgi:hypothetical protein
MKRILQVLTLFSIVLITSCATIIHGAKQDVSITSTPSSAKITIDGRYVGETPMTKRLKRKDIHYVTVELPDYKPYQVTLKRKLDVWVAGNLVFGGLVGLVIDAATGAMYRLTPKYVNPDLKWGYAATGNNSDEITVCVALEVQPDSTMEKIGQLTKE